jgi:hypothetical protein
MSRLATRQGMPAPLDVRRAPAHGGQSGRFRFGSATDAAEHDASRAATAAMRPSGTVAPGFAGTGSGAAVPAGLNASLRALDGAGQALSPALRARFEPRFRTDFSAVRVHADPASAGLAAALNARAFALGPHLLFGRGEYAPDADAGQAVIAHELAHVAQQGLTGEADGTVRRLSYAEIKDKAVAGLASGLHTAENAAVNGLRKLAAAHIPASMLPAANGLIEIIDVVIGAIFALISAVAGIITGFGEGIVSMIGGLVTLGLGVLKLLYDVISGFFTNFDAAWSDLKAAWEALTGLPAAIKKLTTDWIDEFSKASSERQSFMIGELTGQVLALIATFAASASRAGTIARIGAEAGETGGTGAAVADTASAAAKARPALGLIEGGGGRGAGATASAGGATTAGNTALKVAPAVEEAPAASPLRLVPPPAAEPAPAAGSAGAGAGSTAVRAAAVVGKAADTAEKGSPKKGPPEIAWLQTQVQWNSNDKKNRGDFRTDVTAPTEPGVTTAQTVAALAATMDLVTPKGARKAAEPAAEKQRKWILSRPPGGIPPGHSFSEYFDYGGYRDARVDIENFKGQNLRI